ncbi:hypothetical protein HanRHA438_Chr04g0187021 [Helianthus annuus]|nr:hypothetical protein HanRHA438_Chr04g0187021 [Helianthus annuus]
MMLPQINLRPFNMTDVYLNHHLYSDHPRYYKRNKMSSVVINKVLNTKTFPNNKSKIFRR